MHSLDVRLNLNILDLFSLSCEPCISLYSFFDQSLLLFVGEEGYSFPVALSHIIPVVVYQDCKTNQKLILKDNKGKAGIYRWTNIKTGQTYLGSAVNLSRRLRDYFSPRFLASEAIKNSRIIYRALLKYGISNYTLEIIEYSSRDDVISREQHYLDLEKP